MKKKFIKFLKKNNAYEEYERNLEKNGSHESVDEFLDEYANMDSSFYFVLNAFIWPYDESQKWLNLHYRWLDEINFKYEPLKVTIL